MAHRTVVIAGVALVVAFALPLYFFVIKKRAAATLDDLLAERFTARPCPVDIVEVPSGGRVQCRAAYDDKQPSGLVLVLGSWDRGQVKMPYGTSYVANDVAGLFKPNADATWLSRARATANVIAAAQAGGGAIVIWSGLPSHDTIVAHLEAVR